MFVCNVKISKNKIFKILLTIMIMIAICLGIVAISNVFKDFWNEKNSSFLSESDCIPSSDIAIIKPENYSNILKEVHENIDTYIGQKVCIEGYIYRLSSFSKDQFVIARDMDIGDNQTLIVGFLCSSPENAQNYIDYTWVKLTGEITKGTYNNSDIPILNVLELEEIQEPESSTIPLPDDEYIPTAVIY